jgi:penicillin-binding protein 1A
MSGRRRFIIVLVLGVLAVGAGSLIGLLQIYLGDLPQLRFLEEYRPSASTRILDCRGTLIGELYVERRKPVRLSEISPVFLRALVAVEDERFFDHVGVDVAAILRAVWADIRSKSFAQGGSTITQQLTRTLFLDPDKSLKRKIREAILSIQIENRYTKEEILELYCNQIYLGSGVYGIEAAAQKYFGVRARDLDVAQSALIAGLPKAPSYYDPLRFPERAGQRRSVVLRRMFRAGVITAAQLKEAEAAGLELVGGGRTGSRAPYVVEHLRQQLEETYGTVAVYQQGMEVRTTLDLEVQAAAESALAAGLESIAASGGKRKGEPLQGAVVALDARTGGILAMVGGTDFSKSQFNRAIQAKRQPGSGIKPLIFTCAVDGGSTAATVIDDSPVKYWDEAKQEYWEPGNYDDEFRGETTLNQALTLSRNVVTVKLLGRLGVDAVAAFIRRMGVKSPMYKSLSLALGASEVNLLELTGAYGVLANGGIHALPYFVTSVSDNAGKVIDRREPVFTRVVSPGTAYVVLDMMRSVVQNGTGTAAAELPFPVAAKTGTTNDYQDAWFVGFSSAVVAGVWLGFDDNRTMGRGAAGGRLAGPIWADFISRIAGEYPGVDFPVPDDIEFEEIDPWKGDRCPGGRRMAFVRGTVPESRCRGFTKRREP